MTVRHLTASAAVIDTHAHKVLLVWHNASGVWQFPGGHLDPGETPGEAAVREVEEETGVHATLAGVQLDLPGMRWQPSPFVTAVIQAPSKPERPGMPAEAAHEHVDLLFVATGDSSAPVTAQPAEVKGVVWQPLNALTDLPVRAEVPMLAAVAAASVNAEAAAR